MGATYVVAHGNAFFLAWGGTLMAAPLDINGTILWAGACEATADSDTADEHSAIARLLAQLPPND